MKFLTVWRNASLRSAVEDPNLEKFSKALSSGADPLQLVLDPKGTDGQMTTLMHALLSWPSDGRGAYKNQQLHAAPRDTFGSPLTLAWNHVALDRQLAIPFETFRPFIAEVVKRGLITGEECDPQGVSVRSVAQRFHRDALLPQPTLAALA